MLIQCCHGYRMPQYFIAGMIGGLCCVPVTACVERVKCVMQVWSMGVYRINYVKLLVLRFNRVVKSSPSTPAPGIVHVNYTDMVVLLTFTRVPWQQC